MKQKLFNLESLKLAKIWLFFGLLKANIGHLSTVMGRTFFLSLRGTICGLNFMYMCQGFVEGYETTFFNLESLNEEDIPHTKKIEETVELLA